MSYQKPLVVSEQLGHHEHLVLHLLAQLDHNQLRTSVCGSSDSIEPNTDTKTTAEVCSRFAPPATEAAGMFVYMFPRF